MRDMIRIQPQKRKSLALKVVPQGIVVLIPEDLAPDSARVRRFIGASLKELPEPETISQTDFLTAERVHDVVSAWAQRLGVEIRRTQIRAMRSKWASCSNKGTLTLSSDVLHLPADLVDYIICHELLHLKIPNHGKAFQAMMACYIPDWRERTRRLARWMLRDSESQ